MLSSVVRRYISFIVSGTSMNFSFYTFSGTLVYVIVSDTAVHLFHRQWYVDESLFIPSVERWCMLSSVVPRYISFIVNGTSMNLSFYTFSGTLVYVIVSGMAVHLFHCQWYVDVFLF